MRQRKHKRERRRSEINGQKKGLNSQTHLMIQGLVSFMIYNGAFIEFDKNVITPGTEFMWKLSKSIQHYIIERLQSDVLWKGLKVIYSDASVPGEGEHKILDFIRS